MIASAWKLDGDKLTLTVTIPPNTTATVYVPAKDADHVSGDGLPASESSRIQLVRMEAGRAVMALGSGSYIFTSTLR